MDPATAHAASATVLGLSGDAWSAVGSIGSAGALLIGAGAAVVATLEYLSGRQSRRDQERPYMILTVEPSEAGQTFMEISVRNIGSTPAHDLRIEVDPPFQQAVTDEPPLDQARIFTETIEFWPPGHELRFFFDSHIHRNGKGLPTVHRATLTYSDGRRRLWKKPTPWTETSVVDLDLHAGTTYLETYGIHAAAKALREIRTLLDRSTVVKNGELNVVTETRDERSDRLRSQAEVRRQGRAAIRAQKEAARAAAVASDGDDGAEPAQPEEPDA